MKTKFQKGDCISIKLNEHTYLGVIISRIYKKHYDLTLLNYLKDEQPSLDTFLNGECFGTRFGPEPEIIFAVNVRMLLCDYLDNQPGIEKVGNIDISPKTDIDGYGYINSIDELYHFFNEELFQRITETENAKKFPALGYVGKHLISVEKILETTHPST